MVVEFADAHEVEVGVTWVSPPIDAGFYFYEVPEDRRESGRHLTALVGYDEDGSVVGRETFRLPDPKDVEVPQRLPNDELVSLPRRAITERARAIIDFEASDGSRVTPWVMPTTDGGRCHYSSRWGGCPPVGFELPTAMGGGIAGGKPVLFEGEVRDEVVVVELLFEDGTLERVTPVEGFVVAEIGPEHYERGHRLEAAVARDEDGRVLQRQEYRTDFPGVYPCDKPVDIGKGVMSCP